MFKRFAFLLLILAVVETGLFVVLARQTEWWAPIAWIAVAAAAGVFVLRRAGGVASGMRQGLRSANSPTSWLVAMTAGVLLIVPGMITDILAVGLLIPRTRRVLAGVTAPWFRRRFPMIDAFGTVFGNRARQDFTRSATIDVPSEDSEESDPIH